MMQTLKGWVLLGVFVLSSGLFAESSTMKTTLIQYLKRQYIGKKITFRHPRTKQRLRLKVRNVVIEKEAYYAVLQDGSRLHCDFYSSSFFSRPNRRLKNQQMLLQVQTLKSQEAINNVIKYTGKAQSAGSSSSSLRNLEKNIDQYTKKNDFTTDKKIIYTDHITGEEKSNYFIVDLKGLFLEDGTKIIIYLRKV